MKKSNLFFVSIIVLLFILLLAVVYQNNKVTKINDGIISQQNKLEKEVDSSKDESLLFDKKINFPDFTQNKVENITNTIENKKNPIKFIYLNIFIKGGEREKNREFNINIEFFTHDKSERIHEMESTFSNYKINSILVPKGSYYITMEYDRNLKWEKIHIDSNGERWGCKYMIDFSLFYEGLMFFSEKHMMIVSLKKEDEYKNYIPNSRPKIPYEVTRKWVISDVSVMPLK